MKNNARDRRDESLIAHPPEDPACEYPGPILVLAGPGTGKTRSLAKRIKFLIDSQEIKADPEEVTAITFTRGAAAELRKRLSNDSEKETYVPPERQPSWIRTMHSLGNEIIDKCRPKFGLCKGFKVLAGQTVARIMAADAASLCNLRRPDAELALECRSLGDCTSDRSEKCQICDQYKNLLRCQNAVDFDDLIYLAVEALEDEKKANLRAEVQHHARHLLVDEYQDINPAQYRLIRLLCDGQEDGLFVVGDDDQSIYSSRGGSPGYVLHFETHFGHQAKVRSLDEGHRCLPSVLNGALSLVEKNGRHRRPKLGLRSVLEKDEKIIIHNAPSAVGQARFIAAEARSLTESHEVMVLTPSMKRAALVKKELGRLGVAYDCKLKVEETGLFLLDSVAKWVKNEDDDLALRLCIEKIVQNPDLRIPFEQDEGKEALLTRLSGLWESAAEQKTSLYAALLGASENSKPLAYILEQLDFPRTSAQPHEYLSHATRAVRPWASLKGLWPEISQWVADGRARSPTGANPVKILSIHGSKGLTTDYVFVIGLEQGTFPKIGEGAEKEREQRRMMYVAMTRARRALYLCHARSGPGDICHYALRTADSPKDHKGGFLPSQFLDEIDKAFTEERGWRHPLPKDRHTV